MRIYGLIPRLPTAICLALCLALGACADDQGNNWLGYAEGDVVNVAAPAPGWVIHEAVTRGSMVKPGTPLFDLDDTAEKAAVAQAQAQIKQTDELLAQAQANLVLTRKTLKRQAGLVHQSFSSQQAYDQAKANNDSALADVARYTAQQAQTQAQLVAAEYQLAQRHITARVAGQVQDIYFRPGEYAPAMTPVVSLLPPQNIYVRFFVPEVEFSSIHLGDKVTITCDGCTPATATISFIAAHEEYTPPVVFSLNSRSKLVYKVEARAPGGLKLNPGQPVDVTPAVSDAAK